MTSVCCNGMIIPRHERLHENMSVINPTNQVKCIFFQQLWLISPKRINTDVMKKFYTFTHFSECMHLVFRQHFRTSSLKFNKWIAVSTHDSWVYMHRSAKLFRKIQMMSVVGSFLMLGIIFVFVPEIRFRLVTHSKSFLFWHDQNCRRTVSLSENTNTENVWVTNLTDVP